MEEHKQPTPARLKFKQHAHFRAGRCVSCDAFGEVGLPCKEGHCARLGFHFIPADSHRRATEGGAPMSDLFIGRRVGDFLVVDYVDQGGFSNVYLALAYPLMNRVAFKVMHLRGVPGQKTGGPLRPEKFQAEAEALAALNHPNIVKFIYFGQVFDRPYLVMEYVPATTLHRDLAARANRRHAFTWDEIHHIVNQVLNGLESAHHLGIVHRDVKPGNLLLQSVPGNPYLVRIVDFGLAKFLETGPHTLAGAGTPAYMAPEMFSGGPVTPATDVYSVGVVLYEMLTGLRPFSSPTLSSGGRMAAADGWNLFASKVETLDLPERLGSFFERCLQREVRLRFRTAQEFRSAFEELDKQMPRGALFGPGEWPLASSRPRTELGSDSEMAASASPGRLPDILLPLEGLPFPRKPELLFDPVAAAQQTLPASVEVAPQRSVEASPVEAASKVVSPQVGRPARFSSRRVWPAAAAAAVGVVALAVLVLSASDILSWPVLPWLGAGQGGVADSRPAVSVPDPRAQRLAPLTKRNKNELHGDGVGGPSRVVGVRGTGDGEPDRAGEGGPDRAGDGGPGDGAGGPSRVVGVHADLDSLALGQPESQPHAFPRLPLDPSSFVGGTGDGGTGDGVGGPSRVVGARGTGDGGPGEGPGDGGTGEGTGDGGTARVRLATVPEGATVSGAHGILGVAPLAVAVKSGEVVHVTVEKKGYQPQTVRLDGSQASVEVKMKPTMWLKEP